MYSAACDNGYVAVLADIKIVVYGFGKSGLTNDDRYMHALVSRSVLDPDIDPGLVFLGRDLDICG